MSSGEKDRKYLFEVTNYTFKVWNETLNMFKSLCTQLSLWLYSKAFGMGGIGKTKGLATLV